MNGNSTQIIPNFIIKRDLQMKYQIKSVSLHSPLGQCLRNKEKVPHFL